MNLAKGASRAILSDKDLSEQAVNMLDRGELTDTSICQNRKSAHFKTQITLKGNFDIGKI